MRHIFNQNKHVVVAGDIMYVAGLKFCVTVVTRGINLVTVKYLPDRKKDNIKDALPRDLKFCWNKGMHVTMALADQEFERLKGQLGSTDLNAEAAAEHVPEIEQQIRLVKERFRALKSTIPYKLIPGQIIVEAVSSCVTWLNASPTKMEVSKHYSLNYHDGGDNGFF